MSWAEAELNGIDLGDKRLNKRAVKMLDCFSEKPTLSIPGACNGWGETQAAYRFLANEDIEVSDILAPHQQQTHANGGCTCIRRMQSRRKECPWVY